MKGLEEFVSCVERPAAFDAFWHATMQAAARIPLNEVVRPVPHRSTPEVEAFEAFYDSLDGVRVAAWYCVPRRRVGRLPALVAHPGYISDPKPYKSWAREGYAVLSTAPRGKLRSCAQFNPGYPGLLTCNITDRNTYAYRGFFVDALRAVDLLLALPGIDPDRIGVLGSSQGGALTVVTAALHGRVAAAAAGAPYLACMMDCIELTSSYPYQEIRDYLRLYPERRDAVRATLAFFDGLNFAPSVRCPVLMNVGLQDNVCPPESGFALFRALGAEEKRLVPYDGHGHEAGLAHHTAAIREFFAARLCPSPDGGPRP